MKFISLKLILRKITHLPFISKFKNKNLKETFSYIYKKNHWAGKESISGKGSDLTQTATIIKEIPKVLNKYSIKTFLDVPCGDFNWAQYIKLGSCNYIGGDIVDELISKNKSLFKHENITFKVLNLVEDKLPEADLLMSRDCFVHLSYNNIFKAINNIKSSNCTYLLATTFTNRALNFDTVNGHWRTLNLEIDPFNFPKPLQLINENCTEKNGKYKDKSLALWRISDLPNFN
ncbi:MAG: class I SAM-dependent methyltransferase [Bacteroidetes bacterium]|nr:class I SAM-dependent methyltransferase [Bacteroidota bacterium]